MTTLVKYTMRCVVCTTVAEQEFEILLLPGYAIPRPTSNVTSHGDYICDNCNNLVMNEVFKKVQEFRDANQEP
jgi:hypothetical protein